MTNNEAIEAVLKARYYQPGETDWLDICVRVCDYITGNGSGGIELEEKYQRYLDAMKTKQFIPNSPVLFNFGTKHPMGSACFVLKVEDNIDSIYTTLHEAAKVFKMGGGCGFNMSRIRPANAPVQGTNGVASGVVSFLKLYDASIETIKQGGKRRGAAIAILNVDHPEIEDFITCKNKEGVLTNFNISVLVNDEFLQAVENNANWALVFDGKVYKIVNARELYNKICQSIWTRAEPGLLFSETINLDNPGTDVPIDTTNPCGEQPLQPYESCVLGSINLVAMLKDGKIDYELLNETTRTAIDFLNDVIDENEYPLPAIEKTTKSFRKVGLGVMGFADVLIAYGSRYDNTPETLELIDRIMDTIKDTADTRSRELASEFGAYPNYKPYKTYNPTRNATRLAIAPTGTISMIAGVSSGIEPNFSYVYDRKNSLGTYLQVHEQFEKDLNQAAAECRHTLENRELLCKSVIKYMHEKGTIQDIKWLPKEFRNKYVTATDVSPEAHIAIQACFQRYVDSSISKTINCPESTTVEDIEGYIMSAWKQGIKGLTFYRQNSREDVVLNLAKSEEKDEIYNIEDFEDDEHLSDNEEDGGYTPDEVEKVSFKRPKTLDGKTFKMASGCGTLYVTINKRNDKLYECFIKTGGSGGCSASMDAIARLISISLRNGIDVETIAKQMGRVKCDVAAKNKCDGKSCADIIGKVLKEMNIPEIPDSSNPTNKSYLTVGEYNPKIEKWEGGNLEFDNSDYVMTTTTSGLTLPPNSTYNAKTNIMTIADKNHCPDCGAPIVMSEGCRHCENCGWSKC